MGCLVLPTPLLHLSCYSRGKNSRHHSSRASSSTINGWIRCYASSSGFSSVDMEEETKRVLDWPLLCNKLSHFTSTTMALNLAQNVHLPLGQTFQDTQQLLDQTMAATLLPEPLDFSGIQDISDVLHTSSSGSSCTIQEICTVRTTLPSAKRLLQQLVNLSSTENVDFSPLLDILKNVDFCEELGSQIDFCLDCRLSLVMDRASENLKSIREEKRKNIDELEILLKGISEAILRSKGINKPLITRRRSRMCVAVLATHKSLLPEGIVLDVSSSGATYFMEPRDAVVLNNKEVLLSSAEKNEEIVVLGFLSSLVLNSARKLSC